MRSIHVVRSEITEEWHVCRDFGPVAVLDWSESTISGIGMINRPEWPVGLTTTYLMRKLCFPGMPYTIVSQISRKGKTAVFLLQKNSGSLVTAKTTYVDFMENGIHIAQIKQSLVVIGVDT